MKKNSLKLFIFLITLGVVGISLIFGYRAFIRFQGVKQIAKILSSFVELEIQIFNGKFEPSTFKVKPKEMIVLTLISIEGEHLFQFENSSLNWVHSEFKEAGETRKFTFYTPQEKGEYHFYCTQEGHREAGEEGVMIVE